MPARSFQIIYPRNRIKRAAIRVPVLGRVAAFLFRMQMGFEPLSRLFAGYLSWLVKSREWTNLTFHITDYNVRELAEFVHLLTGTDRATVKHYFDEILSDTELTRLVQSQTAALPFYAYADDDVRLGRRIGWYALVRILKPRVVVESGIDKGLGTCVLAAAILRNREEGSPGKVYGLDIQSTAGWLLQHPYDGVAELRIGDSHATLRQFSESPDLFIHDSNHSYHHESGEYEIIEPRLANVALVLSDNAHQSPALMDFAERINGDYYFWPERPRNQFYPSGGIGAVLYHRTGKSEISNARTGATDPVQ